MKILIVTHDEVKPWQVKKLRRLFEPEEIKAVFSSSSSGVSTDIIEDQILQGGAVAFTHPDKDWLGVAVAVLNTAMSGKGMVLAFSGKKIIKITNGVISKH
ncbi:hypothetical protein HRbin37_02304 [bacterium HR37]|jgi:hypothetical protein|nr:hypothetical protein HRbin37_02304 [bacterium HR37]